MDLGLQAFFLRVVHVVLYCKSFSCCRKVWGHALVVFCTRKVSSPQEKFPNITIYCQGLQSTSNPRLYHQGRGMVRLPA